MPAVNKIDSNITGLAYAEEVVLGSLAGENGYAGTPVWYALEPNSYDDFGGEISTVAPNPINPSRQRRKGVTVDLQSSGGFNQNFSFFGLKDIMQGAFFANIRAKGEEVVTAVDIDTSNPDEYEVASTAGFLVGSLIKGFGFTNSANNALNVVTAIVSNTSVEVATGLLVAETPPANSIIKVVGHQAAAGDIDVVVTGDFATLTSSTLNFTTLGLVPGQWIYIGDDAAGTKFTNAVNNGYKRIRSISANALVIDKSAALMTAESSTTETIRIFFGDVLKNELGTDIVRRSYQLERTLGVPNTDSPTLLQSEVIVGAVLNEVTINVPTAELMTVDLAFLGIDNVQRTAAQKPKQLDTTTWPSLGAVQRVRASDVLNTSSDVKRIRMTILSDSAEYVAPLFAFVTEATFNINNNVSPDKAVGILGAFDMSTGTFAVTGSVTAYFSTVEAIAAVRNNSNVTIDMILAKNNQGVILDLPLISLGDGRLSVEQDTSITLPLNMDAATAVDINPNLDYTAMLTYFWYLPTVAM